MLRIIVGYGRAFENRVAIIYFLGIAPGRYPAFLPVFISNGVMRCV